MRVIVLGGTGYLGSRLVKRLVSERHELLCLKREASSLKNLEAVAGHVQMCDIEQLPETLSAQPACDCLLNAACRYPRGAASDMDIFQANLFVPLRVFLDCLNHGVKKYITIGTCLPDEFNSYSVSKRKLADLMRWYGERRRDMGEPIHICNVELENFYGEGEPKDRFIPGTIEKLKRNEDVLLTTGEQKRDFIHVEDAVEGIVTLVNSTRLPEYMDFPLGTGEGVSIRAAVEYLKEITGSGSKLCFGAVEKRINEPDSIADRTKMEQFGIHPKYSWREGAKKLMSDD